MRSTKLLCQTAALKYQQLKDELMILKGSMIAAGEKQELIDIISSKISECEFAIIDLGVCEKNLKHSAEQRRLTE